jgi:5-methylcytosine-specific restriction endonuclease McrA
MSSFKKGQKERIKQQLFVEQFGLCWLCDFPMRLPASKHKDSATVDHVIPVSKGGTNARANLRLAHRRCNTLRSNNEGIVVIWRPDLAKQTHTVMP